MTFNPSISEQQLRNILIAKYRLFANESLWLDAYGESSGTCVVCCHTYFNISLEKCKQIARFIKKQIPHHMFTYIYVGPFHFKPTEL